MTPWPIPHLFEHGSAPLWLAQNVLLVYSDDIQNKHDAAALSLLDKAFERFKSRLFDKERFIPYKFHPRKAQFEPALDEPKTYIRRIRFKQSDPSQSHKRTTFSEESYAVDISLGGTAIVTIASPSSVIHALNTLTQLFYGHSGSETEMYTLFAPIKIRDQPAFAHRGLNLDISRNQISPPDVLRTIEAMGFNKLNKLHLHASDSQSWPLEIPSLPELADEGAYCQKQIWSVQDLEKVQKCGCEHGVEVYLEIDMPGHTASIAHSHPELVTAFKKSWPKYALEPPAGQLKLNSPDVPPFIEKLLKDLLPRCSLSSKYFHIGGDEINTEAYKLDETVKSSDRNVLQPLLQKFINHVVLIVQSHGMTPIAWEDMLFEWDIDFPPQTIIQTWHSKGALAKVVEQGYQTLFGAAQEWYLDTGLGTFLDPDPSNPNSPVKRPYPDWCPPYKNWRQILSYDPLAEIPEDRRHLVIGGEVHLWGELTDGINLDNMLWPRVSAAAGMMWQGNGKVCEESTRAMAEMRERLVRMGVMAGMVQMEYGLRNRSSCIM
ncbi:N-acetyl-glucosamine-6-phosphate deacetylase [Puttea exsequens]|nr:N-acetyl-glucosamine-6-phosphate deacetylase [Puttea exsequens]